MIVGEQLPDAYEPSEIPEVGELDELQTFVGSKKKKIWISTAVDHFQASILGWVVGDHSALTFEPNQADCWTVAVLLLRYRWV